MCGLLLRFVGCGSGLWARIGWVWAGTLLVLNPSTSACASNTLLWFMLLVLMPLVQCPLRRPCPSLRHFSSPLSPHPPPILGALLLSYPAPDT